VKLGHIQIKVLKYADGRWGFNDYAKGKRKRIRLKDKKEANDRARELMVFLTNGRQHLLEILMPNSPNFELGKSANRARSFLR
jgi:hypothetical protein